MITAVREQIYQVGSAVFEPFYFVEAPQDGELPYAVFTPFTLGTNRDTARQYEEIYFQYALFTNNLVQGELSKQQLDAAFRDRSNYSFEAYRLVGLFHLAHLLPRLSAGLWQIGSQFRLEIEPY